MKIIILSILAAFVVAEPPVNSRYLPPDSGYRTTDQNSFAPPSQSYGAPPLRVTDQRQTDAVYRNSPTTSYGPPRANIRRPSQQYGVPTNGRPDPRLQNSYASPSFRSSGFGQPAQEYGVPAESGQRIESPLFGSMPVPFGSSGSGLSPSYGPPGSDRGYFGPGQRSGYAGNGDTENEEPANYSFEYKVKDDDSGNDFGHEEMRMGDRTEGLYYVLLPDGRKQTVKYEADKQGYRPKIFYVDTGRLGQNGGYDFNNGQNGYDSNNGQNGRFEVNNKQNVAYNSDYQNDGPY